MPKNNEPIDMLDQGGPLELVRAGLQMEQGGGILKHHAFDDAFNEYHRISAKQRREKIAGLEQELAFLTKAEG